MDRVLVTAFEPYGEWSENSSWLTLVELTRDLPDCPLVTTRRYPVDYEVIRDRLAKDLADDYDLVLHLGQAPRSCAIRLETVAINRASDGDSQACRALVPDGPAAYFSKVSAGEYVSVLRQAGFPAFVSRHAGTYLCNAALYLSHHIIESMDLPTKVLFVHLPLDPVQAAAYPSEIPSMRSQDCAQAIRILLQHTAHHESSPGGEP